jgi:hypothetical protein
MDRRRGTGSVSGAARGPLMGGVWTLRVVTVHEDGWACYFPESCGEQHVVVLEVRHDLTLSQFLGRGA